MEKEALYERIEAYLAGDLPPEEREEFERQMAADPALAAEVALHRRLEKALSDKPKQDFRRKVADLAEEFPPPSGQGPVKGSLFRWWLPVLAVLVTVAVWWQLTRPDRESPEQVMDAPDVEEAVADTLQPGQLLSDTVASPTPPAASRQPAPERSPAQRPQAFAPNPALEQLIARAPDAYYTVATANLEISPGDAAGAFTITFFGELLTALDIPEMTLSLLDNKGKAILGIPVTVALIEEENRIYAFAEKKAYRLTATHSAELAEGLYYGELKVVGKDEGVWVGKVVVGGGR